MSPESIQRPLATGDSEIPGPRPEVTLSGGHHHGFLANGATAAMPNASSPFHLEDVRTPEPDTPVSPGGCEGRCHVWCGSGLRPVFCALRSGVAGITGRAKHSPRRSVSPSGACALRMGLRGRIASSRRRCRHRTARPRGSDPPDTRPLTEPLRTRRRCTRRSHCTLRRCRSNCQPRGSR